MIKILVFSRIMFYLFAWIGMSIVALAEGYLGSQVAPNTPYLVWVFANMDGRHLLDIASKGYEKFNFAYFPLYPAAISFIRNIVLIQYVYIGLFISLACFFGAAFYIYKIVKLDYSESIAKTTILIFSIFPLSFFYQAVYTDSLFVFLSTACFYHFRKKEWMIAGFFGYFMCLTRLVGIALPIVLFTEWFTPNRVTLTTWRKNINPFLKGAFISIMLTSAGFFSYLVYLHIFHGNYLLFQKSFSAWQQSSLVFPPQVFYRYLKILLVVDKSLFVYWISVFELICTFIYLYLSYYAIKKIRLSYGLLMFLIILIPTFTGTFAGMPRYALHMFPIFLTIALLIENNTLLKKAVVVVFVLLGLIFSTIFTRGYFLA